MCAIGREAFVIHNLGQRNREEDYLNRVGIVGHYRFDASVTEQTLIPWKEGGLILSQCNVGCKCGFQCGVSLPFEKVKSFGSPCRVVRGDPHVDEVCGFWRFVVSRPAL